MTRQLFSFPIITRFFLSFSILIVMISFFSGCHVAQEKAWQVTMETIEQKIAEDEYLTKNIHHVELERRQFVRVYINPQKGRANFANLTVKVAEIAGAALFAQEGNKFTEIIIYGNLIDGDELIECKYTPESGVQVTKDRSMHTM
ncbi:hypothetical protein KKB99_00470 [bacterium]|nr:hypothetical protein [bacterium]MBU1024459.1 hypothetical protein [bacterium]